VTSVNLHGAPGGAGGSGAFGPAGLVVPAFLSQGDSDQDGQLSREEFTALGNKWFTAWDTERTGNLNANAVRAGLHATLAALRNGPGGPGDRGALPVDADRAEGKRKGLASKLGIEFPTVFADLTFEGQTFENVTVRYKGNGTFVQSRGALKRSLKVDVNDGFRQRHLAGMSKLNLHSCVTDASFMNEALAHRLFRDAGVPAPRTAYARVYLTVPGKYEGKSLGLYGLVENVDNAFALDRFATKQGAILKPVTRQLFEDLGDDWAAYRQVYDPKTPVSEEERRRLIAFCKLVSHASMAQFAAQVENFLDLDQFARFMAVTTWLSALDSILGEGQNYYIYLHPKTRRFVFIPWDLDHSFGQFFLIGTQELREKLSILKPWLGERRFLERVFGVLKFKHLYLARLREFSETILRPQRFHDQVDELAAVLRPVVGNESEDRLALLDRVVRGEAIPPFLEGLSVADPAGSRPPGSWEPIKPVKAFVTARAQAVNNQLAGRARHVASFHEGPVDPVEDDEVAKLLGPAFVSTLDADQDGGVSQAEFRQAFQKWFTSWDTDRTGALTAEKLRAGVNKDLAPFAVGNPAGGVRSAPPKGLDVGEKAKPL
jgi:hypothetical protein